MTETQDDRMDTLFKMQAQLNERVGVPPSWGTNDEEKSEWVLRFVRAMQQELAELTDSVPWKWWAKYQELDLQNAKVEAIDLLHFLISIFQVLGMDAADVYQMYTEKHAVNNKRQDAGYATKDEADCKHIT